MPTASEKALLRPRIVPIDGYEADSGACCLPNAIAVTQKWERDIDLGACIAAMAKDYSHPEWGLVRETLAAFHHLPATTLDLWDAFARQPAAMAMLLVISDAASSAWVLDIAEELPFSWDLVPLEAWFLALSAIRDYIEREAPEGMATLLVEQTLEQKFSTMVEADPVLSKPSSILRRQLIGKADQVMIEAASPAAPMVLPTLIMEEAEKLRGRHSADARWPEFGSRLFYDLSESAPGDVRRLFDHQAGYMNAVLHAPIAMAYRACALAAGARPDLDRRDLYQLQTIRGFAPLWYTEAFGLTCLYLCATDNLTLDGEPV
jgi:hypothetical protein